MTHLSWENTAPNNPSNQQSKDQSGTLFRPSSSTRPCGCPPHPAERCPRSRRGEPHVRTVAPVLLEEGRRLLGGAVHRLPAEGLKPRPVELRTGSPLIGRRIPIDPPRPFHAPSNGRG